MHRKRPKVLFFDYWTKGVYHFTELMRAGEPNAADYELLHLGSFRDPKTPKIITIDGLKCVDVSAFSVRRLDTILRSLSPDVLVGLNMSGVCDRAVFLACRRLGIPTVFVQHGAWLDRHTLLQQLKANDRRMTFADRLCRVPKYLRVLPWYLREVGPTRILTAIRVVSHTFVAPASSHFFPTAPEELWPDRALVHNRDSADLLVENYHLPRGRIYITGNPELDPAFERRLRPLSDFQRMHLIRRVSLEPGRSVVCWLEDAFVEQQRMLGWTEQVRVKYALELSRACDSIGAQLLVRPHPVTHDGAMRRALRDKAGATVSRELDLVDTIEISDVVIGTISTALEVAVVLKKPILVPLWYIGDDPSFSPYVRLGAAVPVRSPTDLSRAIAKAATGCAQLEPTEFVQRRIGRLEGGAKRRILSAIMELARK